MKILVERGWPSTVTYLVYEIPDRYQKMNAHIEETREQRERREREEKWEQQEDRF